MLRRLLPLALVALAAPGSAQLLAPFNVEIMPGAIALPAYANYRPHLLLLWQPSVTPFPLRYYVPGYPPTSMSVTLTLRELAVAHPPGWTFQWNGGTFGTRLVARNWPTSSTTWPYTIWPWSGAEVEYWRRLNVPLQWPGEIGVDYGNSGGPCCYGYHPLPQFCAALIEVGP